MNIYNSIILLIIIVWLSFGILYFSYISYQSKKMYEEALRYKAQEDYYKDISVNYKYFLPKLELESKYQSLLEFRKEKKDHLFRHYFVTLPKCMILGPVLFFT